MHGREQESEFLWNAKSVIQGSSILIGRRELLDQGDGVGWACGDEGAWMVLPISWPFSC